MMQRALGLVFGGLIFGMFGVAVSVTRANAGENPATLVAAYVEVAPQSALAALHELESEAAASRKDEGYDFMHVLREIGRPERFVIIEGWHSFGAYEAHEKAPHARRFRGAIAEIATAPSDVRVLNARWVSGASKPVFAHALFVVTHVDVPPPFQDQAAVLLKKLWEDTKSAGGNLGFSIGSQIKGANHFTVTEIWATRAAFDAHQAKATTKTFRADVAPMLGALFDQRLYRAVD